MFVFVFLAVFSSFALEHTLPLGKEGPVINREGYSLQYNSDCRIPHWVSYHMRDTDLISNVKRTNDFRRDPQLSVPQAALADYKRSGYDRGHMARAGLFTKSKKLMSESFILSNIVPQDSYMNQSGAWRRLEDFEMDVIRRRKEVHIISGAIVGPNDQRIGAGEVCVPEYLYKVLYHPGPKPMAVAFIIPNFRTDLKFTSYAVTVDELERVSGIDFLSELNDELEIKLESSFNLDNW